MGKKSPTNVKHVNDLVENLNEVSKLLFFHEQIGGTGKGNKSFVNVLNKSAVVLLVACWEAFVEDVAQEAFDSMLKHAEDYKSFTVKVRNLASADLLNPAKKDQIWDLAGNGWKDVLKNHRDKILEKNTGNFNTAKAARVDNLFEDLIGLRHLSTEWHWQGMPMHQAVTRLDSLVSLRGDIAHRVRPNRSVLKGELEESINFIQILAAKTSNRVAVHVKSRTGVSPWDGVSFRNKK